MLVEGRLNSNSNIRNLLDVTDILDVGIGDAGNDIIVSVLSDPGVGVAPDEPSATTLV